MDPDASAKGVRNLEGVVLRGALPGKRLPALLPCLRLLALPAMLLSGCRGEPAKDDRSRAGAGQGVPVIVAAAVQEDIPIGIQAVGRVEAINTVTVQSRVQGQVMNIHFVDGQDVKAGDLLYTIDPRPFEAAVHLAQANLVRDKALALDAKQNADWVTSLYRKSEAEPREYQQVIAQADATTATVRADEAALENARLQLEYCTIRSPIDARAGDRITDLGNMVTPNVTPLVLLTQIKPIYVTFTVPEKYLSAIQRQMAAGPLRVEAAIPGDSGPPKRGVLTFLDNRVDAATGTIRLKGTFANEDRGLWPGRFVDVTLILATRKNVVVVPSQAIQARPDGQFVFVVRPDRTVEFRKVLTGETVADRAAVTEGLKPGETVVAEGQLRLVPGARVEVQNVEPGVAREADSTTPRAVSRPAS